MVKRCLACMNLIESNICAKCGQNQTDQLPTDTQLLKPETIIGNRYYIGLPIERNGEGITYIGFDQTYNVNVRIREFFPDTLAHRNVDSDDLVCNVGFEIQYKSLMTDFVELSRQLIGITVNNCLLKAKEILSDNGTIYTIYEDVNGITLTKYLRDNVGELSWEETENLFLPLLYSVKLLNSNGIVHRGISPETIIVTTDHSLKLSGICTSAARAINSEITAELFSGYAAPEQYQKCTSHGEWTDVYSISAVLYKTLTGTMPQRADQRDTNDEVMRPRQLNPSVPLGVSEAIAKGLGYSKSSRTVYVKDLIGGLYAVTTPIQPPQSLNSPPVEKRRAKMRVPVWLIVILVTLPVMLLLFFIAYDFVLGGDNQDDTPSSTSSVFSDVSSEIISSTQPPSEEISSSVPRFVVEDFTGKLYEDVIVSEAYIKAFTFKEKKEMYDETVPIGEVISQDVEKDILVEQGTAIQLTVSAGSQFITLPPFMDSLGEGISPEDYKAFLVESGLKVLIEYVDSFTVPSGQIDHLSHAQDMVVDRSKTTSITIYVAN